MLPGAFALALAAGCSALKTYPGGAPDNVFLASVIESGSSFAKISIAVGLPPGRAS